MGVLHHDRHTFMQEVISLVKKDGLKSDSQAGRSVGYRQVLEYLQSVWGFPSEEGESKGKPYSLQVKWLF